MIRLSQKLVEKWKIRLWPETAALRKISHLTLKYDLDLATKDVDWQLSGNQYQNSDLTIHK